MEISELLNKFKNELLNRSRKLLIDIENESKQIECVNKLRRIIHFQDSPAYKKLLNISSDEIYELLVFLDIDVNIEEIKKDRFILEHADIFENNSRLAIAIKNYERYEKIFRNKSLKRANTTSLEMKKYEKHLVDKMLDMIKENTIEGNIQNISDYMPLFENNLTEEENLEILKMLFNLSYKNIVSAEQDKKMKFTENVENEINQNMEVIEPTIEEDTVEEVPINEETNDVDDNINSIISMLEQKGNVINTVSTERIELTPEQTDFINNIKSYLGEKSKSLSIKKELKENLLKNIFTQFISNQITISEVREMLTNPDHYDYVMVKTIEYYLSEIEDYTLMDLAPTDIDIAKKDIKDTLNKIKTYISEIKANNEIEEEMQEDKLSDEVASHEIIFYRIKDSKHSNVERDIKDFDTLKNKEFMEILDKLKTGNTSRCHVINNLLRAVSNHIYVVCKQIGNNFVIFNVGDVREINDKKSDILIFQYTSDTIKNLSKIIKSNGLEYRKLLDSTKTAIDSLKKKVAEKGYE